VQYVSVERLKAITQRHVSMYACVKILLFCQGLLLFVYQCVGASTHVHVFSRYDECTCVYLFTVMLNVL
jgi:hypothetical protein